MKTEINSENKIKFFQLYSGQEVIQVRNYPTLRTPYQAQFINDGRNNQLDTIALLKPLSSISDEDLELILPVVQKTSYHGTLTNVRMARQVLKSYLNKDSTIHGSHWWEIQDILRSKSYLLPWMGLSVDEIIESGWVKYSDG